MNIASLSLERLRRTNIPALRDPVFAFESLVYLDEDNLNAKLNDLISYFEQPGSPVTHGKPPRGGADSDVRIPSSLSKIVDPRVVEFLFATTRQRTQDSPELSFNGERGDRLLFGWSRVRVPEDHKIGKLELPFKRNLLKLRLYNESDDPKRHFIIQAVESLEKDEFESAMRTDYTHSALLFVHGFNVSFNESLLRFAQILWDTQFGGVPILFSWPSRGGILNYLYDLNSALNARDALEELVRIIGSYGEVKTLYVIAHSMGNLIVLDTLSRILVDRPLLEICEVIMAAPDIDLELFQHQVNKVMPFAKGMTLYASSNDRALTVSRAIANRPRAGDVFADGPVVIKNIDSIDASVLGTEMLGLNHNSFATNRSLIDDIGRLIMTGDRPPHRRSPQIRCVPEGMESPRYWRYVD
ncbi:alpha/beta hydrolase [Bradyrhizobium manausense]|uniref:alpha/beta hydrolase n=1 Tax=Bradyrhizobium manausense TaxID=989370 RepID=UPI001BA5D748|nr:alpha/beta hydrolase [Bradyrhizobium manausense]MBR0831339.1 alpha/beta hydrolase [Bradyrhizobium manausense]